MIVNEMLLRSQLLLFNYHFSSWQIPIIFFNILLIFALRKQSLLETLYIRVFLKECEDFGAFRKLEPRRMAEGKYFWHRSISLERIWRLLHFWIIQDYLHEPKLDLRAESSCFFLSLMNIALQVLQIHVGFRIFI